MKEKEFVNKKLGDKNYTNSDYPMSRIEIEEWLTEFAESEVKNLPIQNVTKRFFSWSDIAIGLILGIFGTIVTIAYLL